ncbi:MAG: hypothetical protein J7J52_04855 [Deltaproteobacteria bacterium]|nr:hypothetical protein [Deltaproteobacteria bacterium]
MARSGIMLAKPFDHKRLESWPQPYVIQPKLNGIRCRAIVNGSHISLMSSQMNEIMGVPHIKSQLAAMSGTSIPSEIELDGELYVHGMDVDDIKSIARRTVNLHPHYYLMQYHVFDVVNGADQLARLGMLKSFSFGEHVRQVRTFFAKDMETVLNLFNSIVGDGYEGIIVRHPYAHYERKRASQLMKLKPHRMDEYTIIDTKEEISIDGIPKNTLGALICKKDNQIFSVGTGMTDEDRRRLWEMRDELASGSYVAVVKYQNLTLRRGVPFFPVVIEVKKGGEDDEK